MLLLPRINVNAALFSRVTLISKVQSSSDLDYFQARDLPCSRVKSSDDLISDCQVDSARLFPLYIDSCNTCLVCGIGHNHFWEMLYQCDSCTGILYFGSHIMKLKDLLILLSLHYFLNVAEPTLQPQY